MILWIILIVLLLIIAVAIGFYFLNGYWWSPMDLFNSGNTAISKLIVD